MGDELLRRLQRAYETEQSGEAALAYLAGLARRGLLPDNTQADRQWNDGDPVTFDGRKQKNATDYEARDGSRALMSYRTVCAVVVDGALLWSNRLAGSVTSKRHVQRWYQELPVRSIEEVSAAMVHAETQGLPGVPRVR